MSDLPPWVLEIQMSQHDDFGDEIVELVNSTIDSIKSVYMSEDFLKEVDQLLAEIPISVAASGTQDQDVNTSDSA
jgi:hypothetical protein